MTGQQLHLFKRKTQRGQAPPAPSEFASQAFLVDVVRRWISPQWRFGHIPNGEYRDAKTTGRLKRLGVTAGLPDLMFLGPGAQGPQTVFVELKRRGGRLSESQQAMRAHLEGCGFAYLCTDSVDQAIEWLKDHGILRGGFQVQ